MPNPLGFGLEVACSILLISSSGKESSIAFQKRASPTLNVTLPFLTLLLMCYSIMYSLSIFACWKWGAAGLGGSTVEVQGLERDHLGVVDCLAVELVSVALPSDLQLADGLVVRLDESCDLFPIGALGNRLLRVVLVNCIDRAVPLCSTGTPNLASNFFFASATASGLFSCPAFNNPVFLSLPHYLFTC